MTTEELSTRIHTTQEYQHIYVDEADDDVWLSINVRGGHTHVTLTKDQARQMIKALTDIVEAE